MVATKMGSSADPQVPEAYSRGLFRGWIDRSRRNLGVDTVVDLVQLRCLPTPMFARIVTEPTRMSATDRHPTDRGSRCSSRGPLLCAERIVTPETTGS